MDMVLITYGTALMQGRACKNTIREDGKKFEKMKDIEVWRWLKLAPTETGWRIQRLRFLQDMIRDPRPFAQLTAAMFGHIGVALNTSLENDGTVSCKCCTGVKMMMVDINSLTFMDGGEDVVEQLQGRPLRLWQQPAKEFPWRWTRRH